MIIKIYLTGCEEIPLLRHVKGAHDITSYLKEIGKERVDKIVLMDFKGDSEEEDYEDNVKN